MAPTRASAPPASAVSAAADRPRSSSVTYRLKMSAARKSALSPVSRSSQSGQKDQARLGWS